MISALLAWVLWFAGTRPPEGAAFQDAPVVVAPDPTAGHRAVLRIGSILEDPALEEAARSGLPLRLRSRIELWRDGFFDDLEASRVQTWVVLYDPLEERYVVRSQSSPTEIRRFASFAAARAAVEGIHALDLRPRRTGRFYYTAVLELETLSLSDLEELELWLRGELQPAVRGGGGSLPGAVGRGVKRLLIRVLGLPARRYETRSGWFRVERADLERAVGDVGGARRPAAARRPGPARAAGPPAALLVRNLQHPAPVSDEFPPESDRIVERTGDGNVGAVKVADRETAAGAAAAAGPADPEPRIRGRLYQELDLLAFALEMEAAAAVERGDDAGAARAQQTRLGIRLAQRLVGGVPAPEVDRRLERWRAAYLGKFPA